MLKNIEIEQDCGMFVGDLVSLKKVLVMGFLYSCIIRKNTEELRNKLLEMGCRYGGFDGSSRPYLYCHRGVFYETSARRPSRHERIVECEENEELFLAVAGMRDDRERWQYFVDEEGWHIATFGMYCPKGSLTMSHVDNFTVLNSISACPRKYHRATLEEIKEFFTDAELYYKRCREERYPEKPIECKATSASTCDEYVININGEERIATLRRG